VTAFVEFLDDTDVGIAARPATTERQRYAHVAILPSPAFEPNRYRPATP